MNRIVKKVIAWLIAVAAFYGYTTVTRSAYAGEVVSLERKVLEGRRVQDVPRTSSLGTQENADIPTWAREHLRAWLILEARTGAYQTKLVKPVMLEIGAKFVHSMVWCGIAADTGEAVSAWFYVDPEVGGQPVMDMYWHKDYPNTTCAGYTYEMDLAGDRSSNN